MTSETSCSLTHIKQKLLIKRKRNRMGKKSKNWLDGRLVTGAHLHILWDTPDRRQSHPPAACRLPGSGTDSVCSHTEFLAANCHSTHVRSARSYHQRYCVGIYSDLPKTTDITIMTAEVLMALRIKIALLGCDDMQSHSNLPTFLRSLLPQSSRHVNNDGARRTL